MTKLINELSWSHSRRNTFNECRRKYFYHYYGSWEGWSWNATKRQKELYLHKKLVNRWMWMGTVVHNAVEYLLKQHREGEKLETLDYYLDSITRRMRKDFGDSMSKKNASRPSRIVGLFEHHYRERIESDVWKALNSKALKCFETFWDSDIFSEIKSINKDDILEIEDLSHFFIDGLKVFASMDFCITKNGKVVIYDWKTGDSENNATSEQLACYALYSNETWGVKPEDVKLIEFNLSRNEAVEHHLNGIDFLKIKEGILDSSNQMKSLLSDHDSNTADEINFNFTEDLEICTKCNFKGVCSNFLETDHNLFV